MKSTKILFGIGLFIAFAFLVALFAAFLLNLNNPNLNNKQNNILINNSNTNSSTSTSSQSITLTTSEVAKHNNANDCWTIISNKVYDVTSLVYAHSGGSNTILENCGKDGNTKSTSNISN